MTLSHFRTVWVSFLAQGWFSHLTCGAWCSGVTHHPCSSWRSDWCSLIWGEEKASGYGMTPSILLDLTFIAALGGLEQMVLFFFFCPFFLPVESSCHLTVLLKSQRGLWSADLDWVWKRKQQHLKWRCWWVWFLFLYSVSTVTLGAHAQVYQVACFF